MARRFSGGLLALLLLAVVVYALWRTGPGRPVGQQVSGVADSTLVGVRAVTLFFSDAEAERWVVESRELVEQDDLHARVAGLIDALIEGPRGAGVATLPTGMHVVQTYPLTDGTLVLDLSREFVQGLSGGSRREEMAVGSIVRTLTANLPEVRLVRIVCQGPLVSAGGHVPLDRPLDPQDWP